MAIPPFSPIRAFLESNHPDLIKAWFLKREGWGKENIDRLTLRADSNSLPFRMMLEAIRIRDLDLVADIPLIKEPYHHKKIVEKITNCLIESQDHDPLIEMAQKYIEINGTARNYLPHLLHETASKGRLDLLKKIIPALGVPLTVTRDYIHFPFNQSVGVKSEIEKAKFRELITVLDPTFEMPRWLRV